MALFHDQHETQAADLWLDFGGQLAPTLSARELHKSQVTPFVSVQHGISMHSFLYDRIARMMLGSTYPCDSIVCSSSASRRAVERMVESVSDAFQANHNSLIGFKGRVDVIPLCVDTAFYRPAPQAEARKRLGIDPTAFVISGIGYLSQTKSDFGVLLEAVRSVVQDTGASIRLMLAGSGPSSYANALAQYARELGLADRVFLLSQVSDTSKRDLLWSSDLFVSLSDTVSESFGIAPVEAMACGVPQIVSDWDGYRETVAQGKTGFLASTAWMRCDQDLELTGDLLGWPYDHIALAHSVIVDAESLAASIKCMIQNPETRRTMAVESRARAEREFSLVAAATRYEALWTDLVQCAHGLEAPSHQRLTRPAYYTHFGHYATRELTDDVELLPTNRRDALEPLLALSSSEGLNVACLRTDLLKSILSRVSDAYSRSKGEARPTLGDIACPTQGQPEALVRRHLLWLVKHDFVRLRTGDRTA